MFKCLKKIAFILGVASCFSIIAPSALCAQSLNIKNNELVQMSEAEFAEWTGGKSFINVLNKKKGEVVCGTTEKICSAEQYCLRCRFQYWRTVLWGIWETENIIRNDYTCAPKYNIDSNVGENSNTTSTAHSMYMSSCAAMENPEHVKNWWGSEYYKNITFTIEEFGFLSDDRTKIIGITWSQEEYGWEGAKGEYKLVMTDEKPTISYAADNFVGCEVMPVKLYNMQSCFFCPLSALIFTAANKVTDSAFVYFGVPFRTLMAITWAVWLAYMTLQQVFPMTKQDAPKFLSTIMKQSFKFFFAYLLLVYSEDVFRFFIVPILDAGLQLGTAIQTVKLRPIDAEVAGLGRWSGQLEAKYFNLKGNGGVTLYEKIEIYLATLQLTLAYMQVIGSTLFCIGSHMMFDINLFKAAKSVQNMKDGLRIMVLGGILTMFAFILTMAFAFYFLDGLLQLAFIGAMMPFMIAGWPFRATAQYATTGFKMLLNTFFIIFFTGFVISVDVELINQSISLSQAQQQGVNLSESSSATGDITDGLKSDDTSTADGFSSIIEAINTQNEANLRTATDIGGVGFMLLIFCCVFGFKFVKEVNPLADSLSAGGGVGVASKVGTMAASAAKGVASKATAPVRKAAGDAIKQKVGSGMSKLKNGTGNFLKNSTKGLNNLAQKGANKLASKGKIGKGVGAVLSEIGKGVEKVGNAAGRGLKESASKDKGGK